MLVEISAAIRAMTKRTTTAVALQHTTLAGTVAGITITIIITITATVTHARTAVLHANQRPHTGATLTLSTRRKSGEGDKSR
jgi:hypothetical protein